MTESRPKISFGHQHPSAKLASGVSLIARLSKSPRSTPKQAMRDSPRLTPTKSPWPAKTITPTQPQTQMDEEKENTDDYDYSPGVITRASCEPLSASASPSPLPKISVAKRQRQDYLMGTSPPTFHIRRDSEVQTSTPVGNSTLKAFENLDISCDIVTPKKSTELSIDSPTKQRTSFDSITRTVSITLSSVYDEINETPRKKRPIESRAPSTLPRRKRSGFLRHRPSKLDLIDHKELTFFPLHAQASDCGNNEPLVFVEDYFVSDYERSLKNPEASIKKCTTCFAPLYEFSSFLESMDKRDACKYSEFVCTKCTHKAFPDRSTGFGRSVRKAQSSYELRSRQPMAQSSVGTSPSRPMWWDSLSRKLRWRWRTKGLIPKDVLDLINPPAPTSHY
ncbi:hypothetical protein B0I72DRAFT_137137 [Yarrowia lipolytica]|uniref:YALI0E04268p n=2 Tax=Yarrowia lipolytica TaxID=4952 RepID=Q6C729_YARLI|nr:YALI0E04268p [Yarrowia lipolytica CLIB122]AOW04935.1 hypothetical protein YALI1_E05145g [Yarrowia lipolytica]KAB8286239.1 hypothetical protein BKA91DRAFT_132152 [Yarrowia lipolytica]KAE8171563.1 hypothetical protein BKA90DRAFT_138979 [Yarrowia lipolytica]KAJ8056512.1 hypothetical protein LXG23DRAFT_46007 [Yarrowia lipolytica]QNQ00362.1 Hypothetical protein YALI2_E01677g [Yarrowia lipolytica]|eukprot:XP_503533.1 YALI0E04268p [Yarrowia lipolytica CLIB122]